MSNETTHENDLGARPMPEFVKRGLVRVKSGNLYLKAPYRVIWFRSENPTWSIVTTVEYADYERGFVVMKAAIYDGEGRTMATAHAEEQRGGPVSFLRKAETNAIARALGLCGYGTEFGEFEEEDVPETGQTGTAYARAEPSRAETGTGRAAGGKVKVINQSGVQCPKCHAPDGAAHTATCPMTKERAA